MTDLLTSLLQLTQAHGWVAFIIVVLLIFLAFSVWRGWQREDRQQKRIDGLQDAMQGQILPVVIRCDLMLGKATECIEQNSRVLERMITNERR